MVAVKSVTVSAPILITGRAHGEGQDVEKKHQHSTHDLVWYDLAAKLDRKQGAWSNEVLFRHEAHSLVRPKLTPHRASDDVDLIETGTRDE